MLTIKEINDEVRLILATVPENKKEGNRMKKRLQVLRLCQIYLETLPDKKFVQSEFNKVLTRMERIRNQFVASEKMSKKEATAWEKRERKEAGYEKLKIQHDMLKIIIGRVERIPQV